MGYFSVHLGDRTIGITVSRLQTVILPTGLYGRVL